MQSDRVPKIRYQGKPVYTAFRSERQLEANHGEIGRKIILSR